MAVFRVECMQVILLLFSGAILSTGALMLTSVYAILKNRIWLTMAFSVFVLALAILLMATKIAGITLPSALPAEDIGIVAAGVATFAVFLWFIATVQIYRTFR